MTRPVVEVAGLGKSFRPAGLRRLWTRPTWALGGVAFSLREGESAGLVGESGSGKTTLGRCLLGLIPCEAERLRVAGFDVRRLGRGSRREFRRVAQMVFQNSYASLDPAFRVRTTLAEAVRIHRDLPRTAESSEIERLAHLVRLPRERLDEFPGNLSGGERRRVGFARALATRPRFVVTDEPVAGLDPPIQVQLIELLRRIHGRGGITFLLISHDLRVVRSLATRVLVLFRGRLVEDAPAAVFFTGGARHPYSVELLESAFRVPGRLARGDTGVAARAHARGCPYVSRCARSTVDPGLTCATIAPPLHLVGPEHKVACHLRREP